MIITLSKDRLAAITDILQDIWPIPGLESVILELDEEKIVVTPVCAPIKVVIKK